MKARVDKGIAGKFTVSLPSGKRLLCAAAGKLKLTGQIFIGDMVEVDTKLNFITHVYPRKNSLIRPYVANIDAVVTIIAPQPAPDFFLIDKVIINAIENSIEPVICVNKSDIDNDTSLIKKVKDNYGEHIKVIVTSALNGDISQLIEVLGDGIICFAGQSAVGKTSLLNALLQREAGATGELSSIGRGRHTTRYNEIYSFGNALVVDTSGFSELNLPPMPLGELAKYYDDFLEFSHECKYRGCSHIKEDIEECAVKRAVESGKLNNERYGRYIELSDRLEDDWKKRYD